MTEEAKVKTDPAKPVYFLRCYNPKCKRDGKGVKVYPVPMTACVCLGCGRPLALTLTKDRRDKAA